VSVSSRPFSPDQERSGEISYRRFLSLDVIGSIVYTTLWITLGATVGAIVLERVGGPARALLLLGPAALIGVLVYRFFRRWRYGSASQDLIKFTE